MRGARFFLVACLVGAAAGISPNPTTTTTTEPKTKTTTTTSTTAPDSFLHNGCGYVMQACLAH